MRKCNARRKTQRAIEQKKKKQLKKSKKSKKSGNVTNGKRYY